MFEGIQIGFIGGGNMGEALVKGLLLASLLKPRQIHVVDVLPTRTDYLKTQYGVNVHNSVGDFAAAAAPQVIVLAVKPQTMASVLGELHHGTTAGQLFISIAAGVPMSALVSGLPEGASVIRVMPNTPALVLQGASALARGPKVTHDQMELAMALFRAVGSAVEVDEKWMDTVTGLSGSGPGYVLFLVESFIDAGVLMGLPRPVARELVLQTVAGTVQMVRETGKHPAELRDMVTSPGGTTITGLAVMEERGIHGAIMRAVEAASLRSRELGKG